MKKIEAIIRKSRFEDVKKALLEDQFDRAHACVARGTRQECREVGTSYLESGPNGRDWRWAHIHNAR